MASDNMNEEHESYAYSSEEEDYALEDDDSSSAPQAKEKDDMQWEAAAPSDNPNAAPMKNSYSYSAAGKVPYDSYRILRT
jgi:hypothetical protein